MNEKALKEQIREAGFRATRPRIEFLRAMRESGTPLAVADITAKIGANVDLVTVYRIAETFEKAGLITRVELRAGKVMYEFAGGPHHHHITCTDCGRVEDVEVCLPQVLSSAVSQGSRAFASVASHSLEFFGTCKKCFKSITH